MRANILGHSRVLAFWDIVKVVEKTGVVSAFYCPRDMRKDRRKILRTQVGLALRRSNLRPTSVLSPLMQLRPRTFRSHLRGDRRCQPAQG